MAYLDSDQQHAVASAESSQVLNQLTTYHLVK